jgi:hypothetical protein
MSLGPYTEDAWKTITKLTGVKEKNSSQNLQQKNIQQDNPAPLDPKYDERNRYFSSTQFYRDIRASEDCLFIGKDNCCEYWIYPINYKTKLTEEFSEAMVNEKEDDDGSKYCLLLVGSLICRGCPAFISEKMVNFLKEKISLSQKK